MLVQRGDTTQTQQQLAEDVTASGVAQSIVNKALQTIQHGIDEVVRAENKRPIYVVADIVNPRCVCACSNRGSRWNGAKPWT